MNKELRKLAIELYNGRPTAFSVDEANENLRQLIIDTCGGTFDYYAFQKNKWDIYAIIAETLTGVTSKLSREIFEPIAQFKDTDLGDRIDFKIENPDLYEVAVIASGTNNLMRQRLLDNKVATTAFELGVKVYAEFEEFVTGRIDWDACVNKVADSFDNKIAELIAKEFGTAYSAINSNLKVEGAMEEEKLIELVQKVETLGRGEVTIYGSKLALSKIPSITTLEANASDKRNKGYVSMSNGTKCVELKNQYNAENNTWALDNDKLYIIPSGVKPILMGFEGPAFVVDSEDGATRMDMQIEYLLKRKIHLAVLKSKVWGAYHINA